MPSAKVATENAGQASRPRFQSRGLIPHAHAPATEEEIEAERTRMDTATARVFGTRPYESLSAFERSRVSVAALFEMPTVDLTIIALVLIYSIFIFLDLALEDDDCIDGHVTWQEFFSTQVMAYVDLIFLSFFVVELVLKSYAYGHRYFKSAVTLFDTTIVVVSYGFTIVSFVVLRLGRIIRVLLIMNKINRSREGLKKFKYKSLEGGVEAPVYKVLELLQDLRSRTDNPTDKRNIAWIVDVIGSDRLYAAVISGGVGGGNLDTETAEWLNSQYAIKENKKGTLSDEKKRGSIVGQAQIHETKATYGLKGITPAVQKQLDDIMSNIQSWDFNVFDLYNAAGGNPLVPVVMTILNRHHLFDRFRIYPEHVVKALTKVQAGYSAVPYHNRLHAADVTQTVYSLISSETVAHHVSETELLAAVLAAACHDYGHPGLNNQYHVKNRLEVAVLYNDMSVLENMHVSCAWSVLTHEDHNLFGHLSGAEYAQVRETMISMVLGTDMSGHFDELARFMTKTSSNGFDTPSPENTKMILKMALHCSDVSNPAKKADICIPWAIRVMEEFFMQGDKEKAMGNAVSPFMDRDTTQISKCQGGFIKIIVTPLYEAWQAFAKADAGAAAVEFCKSNADAWNHGGEDRVERWLAERGISVNDKMLTDHGPLRDPECMFPPVREGQEKFYHAAVVQARAKQPITALDTD